MARVYQSLKIRERKKKNGKSKGTLSRTKRIRVKKTYGNGKVKIKRNVYRGKPSKAPDFTKWREP